MIKAIKILEAFGQVKTIIESVCTTAADKKRELTEEEQKWVNEMNSVMIALRDDYIRESHLPVKELCDIFQLSNQRIYQIRGKQKKAAA